MRVKLKVRSDGAPCVATGDIVMVDGRQYRVQLTVPCVIEDCWLVPDWHEEVTADLTDLSSDDEAGEGGYWTWVGS